MCVVMGCSYHYIIILWKDEVGIIQEMLNYASQVCAYGE